MKMIIIIGLLFIPTLNPVKITNNYISAKVTDKLFLNKLNDYRKHYHLKPLSWNDTIYRIAKYHSKYMMFTKVTSHYEEIEVPNFQLIYDLRQRFKYFGCKKKGAECILGGSMIIQFKDKSFSSFVKRIWKTNITDLTSSERMICKAIWRWHTSESHKEVIQSSKYIDSAVSLRYTEMQLFEKSIFYSNEATQQNRCYAVLNLTE